MKKWIEEKIEEKEARNEEEKEKRGKGRKLKK